MNDYWLEIPVAADVLGLSKPTARRVCKSGEIKSVHIGKLRRVSRPYVENILREAGAPDPHAIVEAALAEHARQKAERTRQKMERARQKMERARQEMGNGGPPGEAPTRVDKIEKMYNGPAPVLSMAPVPRMAPDPIKAMFGDFSDPWMREMAARGR